MTVASEDIHEAHACNGVLASFAFNFKVYDTDDLLVILRTIATGAETVLVEGSGAGKYTVTLDAAVPSAGDITTGTTYAATHEIHILHWPDLLQPTALTELGKFPAKTVEYMIDRMLCRLQRCWDAVRRAPQLPRSTDEDVAVELLLDETADTLTVSVTYADGVTVKTGTISLS